MIDIRVLICRLSWMIDICVAVYRSSPRYISFMGVLLKGDSGSIARCVARGRTRTGVHQLFFFCTSGVLAWVAGFIAQAIQQFEEAGC